MTLFPYTTLFRPQRGQGQHGVAIAGGRTHAMRVANVPREDVELAFDVRRALVEPAPRRVRVVQHERPNVVPGAHQRFDEVGTDETVRTRDENLTHGATPRSLTPRTWRAGTAILQWPGCARRSLLAVRKRRASRATQP